MIFSDSVKGGRRLQSCTVYTKKNKGVFTDPLKIKARVVVIYKNIFNHNCKEKKYLRLITQKWK